MNVVLWVAALALAGALVFAGGAKLLGSRRRLEDLGMTWAATAPRPLVRAVGALEVLGAAGLVLPGLFGIATILVPVAATGLVVLLIGAVAQNARTEGVRATAMPFAFLALAVVVAWGRFGPYPLG